MRHFILGRVLVMTTLSDLARVKAIFQSRAICAAMGIMGEGSIRKDFEQMASSQSVLSASPTNKESE